MSALINKLLKPRNKFGLLLLGSLVGILFLNNQFLGRLVGGFWGNYGLPVILWGLLALAVMYVFPSVRPVARKRHRKVFYWAALLCAAAGVVSVMAAGLLGGFGRSPYDHSFLGVIINLFYLGSMLVGMELSRSWLILSMFAKRPVFGIAFMGIILTCFSFSFRSLLSIETALEGAKFAGNIFFPALSENLLASYLAYLGGPLAAIIYRGTLLAFHWFSPVLPDLNWIVSALVGTFVPVFSMVLIHQLNSSEVLRKRTREKESPAGWISASAVSVVMIWFAVGVFSVFPNVIISGSMSPYIEVGDVVIVQRASADEIKVADVIQFYEEEKIRVAHRVIEIVEDEKGRLLFQTKGDANSNPDTELVYPEQLIGRIIYVVPKVGWITVWMRSTG